MRVDEPYFDKDDKISIYCGGNDYEPLFLGKIGPFYPEDKDKLIHAFKSKYFCDKTNGNYGKRRKFCIVELSLSLNAFGKPFWIIHKIRTERVLKIN